MSSNEIQSLMIILAIGACAGWLAGLLMKNGGFGLIADIIIGIVGAVIGGFVLGLLGLSLGGLIGQIATATLGAMILLAAIRMIKKS